MVIGPTTLQQGSSGRRVSIFCRMVLDIPIRAGRSVPCACSGPGTEAFTLRNARYSSGASLNPSNSERVKQSGLRYFGTFVAEKPRSSKSMAARRMRSLKTRSPNMYSTESDPYRGSLSLVPTHIGGSRALTASPLSTSMSSAGNKWCKSPSFWRTSNCQNLRVGECSSRCCAM